MVGRWKACCRGGREVSFLHLERQIFHPIKFFAGSALAGHTLSVLRRSRSREAIVMIDLSGFLSWPIDIIQEVCSRHIIDHFQLKYA